MLQQAVQSLLQSDWWQLLVLVDCLIFFMLSAYGASPFALTYALTITVERIKALLKRIAK